MRFLLHLLALCVYCAVPLAAQNLYTLAWDQNTDQPTGYRIYDNGTKIGEVPDSPAPEFPITLAADDYATHVYGVAAFTGLLESSPATLTFQQPAPVPVPAPTSQPSPLPESSDGAFLPPASQLIDTTGATYTLSTASMVLKNGDVIGGPASALRYRAHGIEADAAGSWWRYIGGGWTSVGASQPPQPTESADGASVPPLVDAQGHVWTINAQTYVLRDGSRVVGFQATALMYLWHAVYAKGLSTNWWKWTGSAWVNIGKTQPGTWAVNIPSAVASDANGKPVTLKVNGSSVTVSVP